MNAFDALNAAADHIEAHPDTYDFHQGMVRADPRSYACMLAHVGRIAGARPGMDHYTISLDILGVRPQQFYERIGNALPYRAKGAYTSYGNPADAKLTAAAMRKVATKYYGIPAGIKKIFARKRITTTA
jgi:hypothetical protein